MNDKPKIEVLADMGEAAEYVAQSAKQLHEVSATIVSQLTAQIGRMEQMKLQNAEVSELEAKEVLASAEERAQFIRKRSNDYCAALDISILEVRGIVDYYSGKKSDG